MIKSDIERARAEAQRFIDRAVAFKPAVDAEHEPYFLPGDPGPGVAEIEEFQRRANRSPDATVDAVSVIMLDLENRAKAEMRRRDAREAVLKAEIDQVEDVKAILIRELLAEQEATRRASLACVILFVVLCGLEGWRVALWIWRMLK